MAKNHKINMCNWFLGFQLLFFLFTTVVLCIGCFILQVPVLDVKAITLSFTDVLLNIPDMESVPRADIRTDPVEHWKD